MSWRKLGYLAGIPVILALHLKAVHADDMFGGPVSGLTMWQGGYIGAHGGAGLGTAGSLTTGGTLIGMQGGVNFQSNQLVGGGEVDVTASQIKNNATGESFTQNWMTSGRVRGGFTFGNLLTYGTAGLAASAMNYTNTYSTDVTKFGWVYGGGVEAMVMPHVFLRGEFLRYDLGNSSYLNASAHSISLDTQSNVFRFGVGYKF
jgi:outer membrane immunogenic protein